MLDIKTLENKRNIKYRSFYFGVAVIKFLQRLPSNYIHRELGKQLLRSATSIGANIIEAQAGRSRKDFTNYYQIALKSSNETKYWLLTLKEVTNDKNIEKEIVVLYQENVEISKMLSSSLLTLKNRKRYQF